ncbi:hypothetical protein BDD12DRAFT_865977 [Trichophaea hybrida]|nr:hypothetical protein BDD12DRAFT_865977 [Trichophaea hybrida]
MTSERSRKAASGGWGRYVRAATHYDGTASSQVNGSMEDASTRRRTLMQVASDHYLGYVNPSGQLDMQPELGATGTRDHELWLFPTYAREIPLCTDDSHNVLDKQASHNTTSDCQNTNTVCQVDVRGWLFTPHVGVYGRKIRWQMSLIKWMCGLSSQTPDNFALSGDETSGAQETESITSTINHAEPSRRLDGISVTPETVQEYTCRSTMTAAQVRAANAALEQRIQPFTHTPLKDQLVTVFFYDINNNTRNQSRCLYTSENGHFTCSAALPFIPSHVRVLASEILSATEELKIQPFNGVSIISDIDDTVKCSGIMLGTREMARATFTAPVKDFIIEGVAEWYNILAAQPYSCSIFYISNSPWQLYPVLKSFFDEVGLPMGSFHLKHYNGILQGILEPAADRKRGTVERVIQDFPYRKWLLIGDSGEADLEIYTEMAERWPDRILAVCIRDITTRDNPALHLSGPTKYGLSDDGVRLGGNLITWAMGTSNHSVKQGPLTVPSPVLQSPFSDSFSTTPPVRPDKPLGLRGRPVTKKPPTQLLYQNTTRGRDDHRPTLPSRSLQLETTTEIVRDSFWRSAPPKPQLEIATTNTVAANITPDVPPLTKQELGWTRRWLVAKEKLEQKNVSLLSWRVGTDVQEITKAIVERELRMQQRE